MTFVVYYHNAGGYHIDTFTEEEFDHIFGGVAQNVNESWIIV